MTNSSFSSLRYGFELDQRCFVDIGIYSTLIISLVNTFVFHPFPLFILIRKSRSMSADIRRGYIAMHAIYIVYDVIFFMLARIYALIPYSGLYCEGPLCTLGLPRSIVLGLISFSIIILQPPFAFLIIRMHQTLMPDDSPLKLSRRVQIAMACVQLTLLSLNVVGFVVFGAEPDNIIELLREPELVVMTERGRLLLFGGPGNPQHLRYELYHFYVTLVVNFPVLCFFFVHSVISLKQTSLIAKSTQTQRLTKTMTEVFFWQLNDSVIYHVIPLVSLMVLLIVDVRNFPPVLLAVLKLVLLITFSLNSTQFCAIFVLKNATHRQMLVCYFWTLLRFITRSKIVPASRNGTRRESRLLSFSMSVSTPT